MRLVVLFFVAFLSYNLSAQSTKLANQYYQTGEYEKAGEIYKKLFDKSQKNDYYFNKYIDCLFAIEDYTTAEKEIKSLIDKRPNDVQFYVTLGKLYESQDQPEKADEIYKDAIINSGDRISSISKLGNAFQRMRKFDYALETFLKGEKVAAPKDMFSYNLASVYKDQGETDKMLSYYLKGLKSQPTRLLSLQNNLSRVLDAEGQDLLVKQLYTKIQEEPEETVYVEMLQWSFIQKKDYAKALRQARSLDRKKDDNGKGVFEIARVAENDKDYASAIKAYTYIIEKKGPSSSFYFDAQKQLLLVKKQEIISDYIFTREDFRPLEMAYDTFFTEFGKNTQSAWLMMDYAHLMANYVDDLPKASSLLEEVIQFSGLDKTKRAEAKLTLGDYYLMQEERWEATLLYSQVDKDFKEALIGEEARFKNAMLSYYSGDFGWAQEQFDILKAATSRLISNDAIDMSVFIMDNMGLDTTEVPLQMFARADLLIFQSKYDEAFAKLDELTTTFPEHTLLDDILYKKAQIYIKQQAYDKAISNFETIIEKYAEEIRCDNAIFELAQLYENQLKNPDKAQELYKKLFIDYSNSTLAVEGRKRYRLLRGDEIQ